VSLIKPVRSLVAEFFSHQDGPRRFSRYIMLCANFDYVEQGMKSKKSRLDSAQLIHKAAGDFLRTVIALFIHCRINAQKQRFICCVVFTINLKIFPCKPVILSNLQERLEIHTVTRHPFTCG